MKFYPHELKAGATVKKHGYIKGVNWYNLLGDVYVDRLNGEEALRAALAREDIKIERIGECLLIRAGDFPRLGAPEEGLPEPYVFVNRVLRLLRDPNPKSLHIYIPNAESADEKNTKAWAARFDQGDPVMPQPPLAQQQVTTLKVYAGDICPKSGNWHAPHWKGETYYAHAGEVMKGTRRNQAGNEVIWYLRKEA